MSLPIYIYGAGGLGREIHSMLKSMTSWEPKGFIDDSVKQGNLIKGLKVLGGINILASLPKPLHLVLAMGDPITKQKVHRNLVSFSGINYPTLIHPQAILQDRESIQLGAGVIVTAGCILTNDIRVGEHVLINLNCTIGHDTRVEDFASLMPGVNLAGNVSVGQAVLVGSGVNVLNAVSLGEQCRIGAGAVVTKDVPPHALAMGVPAKVK